MQGKGRAKKKWALVAWEKICKPKNYGGLGLDDPEILSKVLGVKLCWCWVKYQEAQWAIIWKEKYSSTWKNNDHIRMSRNIKSSHIWNKAWDNQGLVKGNSFWEIREGNLALFWEDRWQQKPILLKEDLTDLKEDTNTKGLSKVKDFWDETNSIGKWRTWRNFDFRDDSPLKAKVETLK